MSDAEKLRKEALDFQWARIKDMEAGQVYLAFTKENEIPLFHGPLPSIDWNFDTLLGQLVHSHSLRDWEKRLVKTHSRPYKVTKEFPYQLLTLQQQMDNTSWTWCAEFVCTPIPPGAGGDLKPERITSP